MKVVLPVPVPPEMIMFFPRFMHSRKNSFEPSLIDPIRTRSARPNALFVCLRIVTEMPCRQTGGNTTCTR